MPLREKESYEEGPFGGEEGKFCVDSLGEFELGMYVSM